MVDSILEQIIVFLLRLSFCLCEAICEKFNLVRNLETYPLPEISSVEYGYCTAVLSAKYFCIRGPVLVLPLAGFALNHTVLSQMLAEGWLPSG